MCGINGLVNFNEELVAETDLSLMMIRQRHRGPDDEGIFLDGRVGLGFVRLSILDLSSAGHQPMQSADGRYTLVFNGEIYNYIELRAELSKHYLFRTQTDTEVLLNAYLHWGCGCLPKLNGMFAFAIYDKAEQTIFAARDRFGVKPFYYYIDDKRFIFASEIAPIFEHLKRLKIPLQPAKTVLFDYIVYNRTDQSEHTFVDQIKKLAHGSTLTLKGGNLRIDRWYNVAEQLTEGWHHPKDYYELFESSVKLRLRSDVPVGLCLSGGLDSSSIASTLLKGLGRNDLYAFSAVYGRGQPGDEQPYIQEYESQLPNLTYVHPTVDTLIDDYTSFMNCHFEPASGLSIYSQFKLMQDASTKVRVIMDGQGADEQLAGYLDFFASYFIELARKRKFMTLSKEFTAYVRNHKSVDALTYLAYYLSPNSIKLSAAKYRAKSINKNFFDEQVDESVLSKGLYSPRTLQESLIQHFEYKLEHLLKWIDLNSMYHSIEARNPFLDYRLVEKTLATSAHTIIRDGNTKWILREAMRGVLPERIRTRQNKIGFDNPANNWLRHLFFQDRAQEALETLKKSGTDYFDIGNCYRQLDLHMNGDINIAKDIWKWMHVADFLRKF